MLEGGATAGSVGDTWGEEGGGTITPTDAQRGAA